MIIQQESIPRFQFIPFKNCYGCLSLLRRVYHILGLGAQYRVWAQLNRRNTPPYCPESTFITFNYGVCFITKWNCQSLTEVLMYCQRELQDDYHYVAYPQSVVVIHRSKKCPGSFKNRPTAKWFIIFFWSKVVDPWLFVKNVILY